MTDAQEIRPFLIEVDDADLADLKLRLEHTRWPHPVPGDTDDWSRGIPGGYLRNLAEYWRTSYDWRKAERELNSFPQFTTEIDGQTIHFFHVRSPEPDAMPLLITHGYPGSAVEFLRLLGPLSDPVAHGGQAEHAFHVVVPSLPGFGFSTPLSGGGWELGRTTAAFAELMTRLGYERFAAQGGDIGAGVTGHLGATVPDRVIGTHVNSDRGALGMAGEFLPLPDDLDADDLAVIEQAKASWKAGRGYLDLQSHTPETIAPALTDSPVAQLAWIAEKFQLWTDPSKSPEESVDRDQLLTLVSIYWFRRAGASAARFLYEAAHSGLGWGAQSPVPAGWAVFNSSPVVRRITDPEQRIAHWSDFAQGGHFPAMECGELLVEDVRAFFRTLAR
ncbi:epoxide hydrolase family protein [Kribbella sp. NPDC049584]|uniref:epoxide hydrolase family protein n=1 Tax=Kribbella sp. NPDC049584 TaxID=3154833 RepID=UPI00343C1F84